MSEPILHVTGLSVVDHRGDGDRVVIRGWDLGLKAGESVVLQGLSSSDTSLVLDVLAGLRTPAAGRVAVRARASVSVRAHVAHRLVGYVPATPQLLPALTAVENVAVAAAARGGSPSGAWHRAEQLLGRLGLPAGAWHNLVEQLSGGQQQRVEVARALVDRPPLVIADNPTSELDPTSAALVFETLLAAAADGAALVLATTEPPGALASRARIVRLTAGAETGPATG